MHRGTLVSAISASTSKTGDIVNQTYDELLAIVKHLDERFPDDNGVFQRVSRLTEEAGELAMAVNHREGMGVKNEKHGQAEDEHLAKEVKDVLVTTLAIAHHYNLTNIVKSTIHNDYNRI
jgi:NTP pyrophosphatase (non-canonical NTP hydrolase)